MERTRGVTLKNLPGIAFRTYLPLLQFVLLCLVLLDEIVEHLLQTLGIRRKGGYHILNGSLHQDPVNHAEALAIFREGAQSFKNESAGLRMSGEQ